MQCVRPLYVTIRVYTKVLHSRKDTLFDLFKLRFSTLAETITSQAQGWGGSERAGRVGERMVAYA